MVASVSILALIIGLSIEAAIGILANIFILVVNSLAWLKKQRLTSSDIMLFSIGICNILLQCTMTAQSFLRLMWREVLFSDKVHPVILMLDGFTFCSSFWLTAWLCVIYCVKIANFNHRLFLWLKPRLSKMVPWVITGSIGGSVILSAPVFWEAEGVCSDNSTCDQLSNYTADRQASGLVFVHKITAEIIGCCLPMMLVVFSVTLILSSLCKHMWSMKQNMSDNSRPSLEAHIRAAGTMAGLLIIDISLYIAQVTSLYVEILSLWGVVCYVVMAAATSAAPVLLIIGNSKLRGAFWELCACHNQNRLE